MTDILGEWLSSGNATMTQRDVLWVDAQGWLDAMVVAAKARGVHLVPLTDEEGRVLIAASLQPFETLC